MHEGIINLVHQKNNVDHEPKVIITLRRTYASFFNGMPHISCVFEKKGHTLVYSH